MKCRRIFQALPTHAIAELLNVADAYMGPVRLGFINPSLNILRAMHNNDPLEYIERYFLLEQDLSSALDTFSLFRHNRRRYGSRRDTDDQHQNSVEPSHMPGAVLDSEESDSDSENEEASRRFSSTSSLHNHTDNISNVIGNFSRAINAASFNTDPTRRDDNNAADLTIRTGPGDGENSAQTAIRSNGKPMTIEDSNASEKTAFQFANVFAALLKLVDDLMLQLTRHDSYVEKGQA
uniref:Uncharacterized protein n=1 Tax=Panagrolaimus sp. ES5 TaxID=591445 RepID=A0AC34GE38_9BILA